jgi:hypothetical protein
MQVNGYAMTKMGPTPPCWTCKLEHRQDTHTFGITYPAPQIVDHWVVVCQSHPKQGPFEEIAFDYWENRPPGESPAHFRHKYPEPATGSISGASLDCGGTLISATDFAQPTPHK